MKTNEWHWARLKKDVEIDDLVLLGFLKSDPFILPRSTIVWAYTYTNAEVSRITLSPEALIYNVLAYQVTTDSYSSLLEPLE